MANWTPYLIALGKRGPRWAYLVTPWTLVCFSLLMLGHTLRHGLPSSALVFEYERIAVLGSMGMVLLRSEMVARLLRVLLWPTWYRRLTRELMVQLTMYCVLNTSFCMLVTVILGCFATYAPLLEALRFPFRHVALDLEAYEAMVFRDLFRSGGLFDHRIPVVLLDGLVATLIVSTLPLALHIAFGFCYYRALKMHLKWQLRKAQRSRERMHQNLVVVLGTLLNNEIGAPIETLHKIEPAVLREGLEVAIRQRLKKNLEGHVKTLAGQMADAFRNEILRQAPSKRQLRFKIQPTFQMSWTTSDTPAAPP